MSGAAHLLLAVSGKLTILLSSGGGGASDPSSNGHNFGANVATAGGGAGGYSYAWSLASFSGGTWSDLNPLSNPTAFIQVNGVLLHQTATATWTCTVTDALGKTAQASALYNYTYGSPV
jgi:hypothetical protein